MAGVHIRLIIPLNCLDKAAQVIFGCAALVAHWLGLASVLRLFQRLTSPLLR
jgi:hypothetical protein